MRDRSEGDLSIKINDENIYFHQTLLANYGEREGERQRARGRQADTKRDTIMFKNSSSSTPPFIEESSKERK